MGMELCSHLPLQVFQPGLRFSLLVSPSPSAGWQRVLDEIHPMGSSSSSRNSSPVSQDIPLPQDIPHPPDLPAAVALPPGAPQAQVSRKFMVRFWDCPVQGQDSMILVGPFPLRIFPEGKAKINQHSPTAEL